MLPSPTGRQAAASISVPDTMLGRYAFQLPDLPGGLRPLRARETTNEGRHRLPQRKGRSCWPGHMRSAVRG
ncbi:hypothetical protein SAMN05428945_6470 [Streptomyces sp. 2224.1]|nr:hypothetical protein BX261_6062 [Streptomyces sp. 2321.6]SDQ99539.1 hypothetical protein SAMN05216511_1193 [Streptomyces sp. KS_16]SED85492.1 hypothetical protein SAMN05428940_6088 [Streptomyces sp. 2133.1]SEE03872.1 hypothetical protein SAMN05428945_6470 [Streptomyces sp. 2224.1]SNC72878.1 hypothetical protein SAMN06272741_5988 [Streptomyces sp. 2114.4]